MKRISTLCVVVALAGMFAAFGQAAPAAPVAPSGHTRLLPLEGDILTQLNVTRAGYGLRPLSASPLLQRAAVFHSHAMLAGGFFQHESADGSPFSDRLKRFYPTAGFGTWSAGENLLYSTADIDAGAVIKAWLGSPGHRRNLLSPTWREVGIGALEASSAGGVFGGDGSVVVVTMDFGARAGARSQLAGGIRRELPMVLSHA